MSISPSLGELPPSPELQRQAALDKIRDFKSLNNDYRELVTLTYAHPSIKRLENLHKVCEALGGSSAPLIESEFFRNVDPKLVEVSVNALIDEILQNRELASLLDGDSYADDEFDDEFRQGLVERVLAYDTDDEDDDGSGPIIVVDPLEQLTPKSLVTFMGGIHAETIRGILENLEESEKVGVELEKEYQRKERVRTVVVGVVAFAGALGGSMAAGRINKRR